MVDTVTIIIQVIIIRILNTVERLLGAGQLAAVTETVQRRCTEWQMFGVVERE